jgi:hypothetical protein
MTRDDILNMPAGREMDALILEHVFGAKWYHYNHRNFLLMPSDAEGWEGSLGKMEYESPDYIGGFNWSKDIAKAWQVMEKINAIPYDEDGYQVHMRFAHELKGFEYLSAIDAALRICRAALLAVIPASS